MTDDGMPNSYLLYTPIQDTNIIVFVSCNNSYIVSYFRIGQFIHDRAFNHNQSPLNVNNFKFRNQLFESMTKTQGFELFHFYINLDIVTDSFPI